MEERALISVVLVCYDRVIPILKRSMESILSQTYENTEIIVVNTNENEDMSALIEQYIKNLDKDNLQLLYTPGKSNNRARNIGFNATKGEYIAFMDDDDEWTIDKLEKQLEFFDNEISSVYSNYEVFDSNGNVSLFFNEPQRTEHLNVDILGENKIGCTSMPLIKRQAFIDVGGFDESFRANQDWDLWIRLLQNHNAAYSPDIAGIKHYSEGSISSQKYRRLAGWTSIFINHASKYNKNRKQLKKALGHFIWEMFDRKLYLTGVIALPLYAVLKA